MSAIELDPLEARVLGVLLEKEVTTPDAYPLSINATWTACNQKSNRDPVMNLPEAEVRDTLEGLVRKTLVREQGSAGGRTRRFGHRLDSRLFGTLEFTRKERAVLCVLLLRGPQTPGEIRSRTARLAEFSGLDDVEQVLATLAGREDGPHVTALPREPGRREVRWRHLFCGDADLPSVPAHVEPPPAASAPAREPGEPDRLATRLAAAEARLDVLEATLARLEARVGPADGGEAAGGPVTGADGGEPDDDRWRGGA